MKLLIINACLLLLFYPCVAQNDSALRPICFSPAQCSRNLVNPISALTAPGAIKDVERCYAKDCDPAPPNNMPPNYHDVSYAAYTSNGCTLPDDCIEDPTALVYHVFYPSETLFDYSTCKLPVIIFFHGGGFVDCNGSYNNTYIQTICTEFAKRGFIAMSVEYRLGVKLPPNKETYYAAQQVLGMWRAGQDARGAICSIIKREMNNEEVFHIDVNNIFIGGSSAGAVTAMNVAYFNLNTMLAAAFPPGINNSTVLGSIKQNFYYGDVTGPNAYNYTIRGVLDMWGSVLLPQNISLATPEDFFFQTGNTIPPTIAFCGANDMTFPPVSKPLIFISGQNNAGFRSENTCLNDQTGNSYFTVSSAQNTYGNILGSQSIYEMLRRKHVLTEFYYDCQMAHGLDKDGPNFMSDFGTQLTNSIDVNLYMVQRAVTFFQAVMNNTAWNAFATTKFVECPNYRNTCAPADNNGSCYTDATPANQVCPSSTHP